MLVKQTFHCGSTHQKMAAPKYNPENESDWRNIPLFSNTLDDRNPMAKAILELQKEEDPKVRAEVYKDSGNKAYASGKTRYEDALKYYNQGLDMKSSNKELNATLYCNRAQVYLMQKNYGLCIEDCKKAIKLSPNLYKAYFRMSLSYKNLNKFNEGLKYINKGIEIIDNEIESYKGTTKKFDEIDVSSDENDNKNNENNDKKIKKKKKSKWQLLNEMKKKMLELKNICIKEQEIINEKIRKKKELDRKILLEKEKELQELNNEIIKNGININKKLDIYNLNLNYKNMNLCIKFNKEKNILKFPVIIIYPEFNVSEVITEFNVNKCFNDYIGSMFPPNGNKPKWDKNGNYKSYRICIYWLKYNEKGEKLVKVVNINMKSKLVDVLGRTDFEVYYFPVFHAVLKDSKFRNEFLKKKYDELC